MPEHKSFNRLEQGLNTKTYMIALIAALLLIILGIYFFVAVRGKKDIPKANQPHPNSRLVMPSTGPGQMA